MKILSFVRLTIARWYYARALREINPLHPDVPFIMHRHRHIVDELHALLSTPE